MPPKAKGKKFGARKMPPPLPKGEVLTDSVKKQQWVIGASIGTGGFGEIYIAAQKGRDLANAEHVIKIEPHENGPLFSELSYYRRVAKEDIINRWVIAKSLEYLPVPKYVTSGSHDIGDVRYRFMVMQRFGSDIEKHFRASHRFCEDTVSYLALRLLEALEFLHESEYVHADIKGSNLLTGLGRDTDRVYLVDYGLAFRFNPDDSHKEYKEDPKRAHDGTIEFTSIDAHNGVCPARRGDLEILGYCLLQWACGKLPWEDNLLDKNYVASRKKAYKGKAAKLVMDCFGPSGSRALQSYMTEVYKLQYADKPPYSKLKKIFEDQLGRRDPRKTLEWTLKTKPAKPVKPTKRLSEEGPSVPPKHRKHSPVALKQPSSEGSDQVDLGGKKKTVTKKVALPVADRPPPILCLQGMDQVDLGGKTAKEKTATTRKKAKPAAQPVANHLYPQGSDQVDVGRRKAPTLEARLAAMPIADRLPHVEYPPELGYVNSEAEGSSKRVKPVIKEGTDAQRKGRKSPLKEKGTVNRREEVPGTRRSERTRGKVVNYADLSSSFNNSQGATLNYRESSDEEEEKEEGRVGDKRAALKTTATNRKRRRT